MKGWTAAFGSSARAGVAATRPDNVIESLLERVFAGVPLRSRNGKRIRIGPD
jgi:hypothetical protein